MDHSAEIETRSTTADSRPPKRKRRPWLWLALILLAVLGLRACLTAGQPSGPYDDRASRLLLNAEDLDALEPGSRYRNVLPPVDLGQAERVLRGAGIAGLPMPRSRDLRSYREAGTGEEVSVAALLFDELDSAERMVDGAAPLLGSAFGLRNEAADWVGAADGRIWSSATYAAASFRIDGALLFVGTNRAGDPERLTGLAKAAIERARARLPELTPTALSETDRGRDAAP